MPSLAWIHMINNSNFSMHISKSAAVSICDPSTDIETEIPKFQYRPHKFFSRHGEQFGGIRDFAKKRCGECAMHITRDNFDVCRGGRCFSCAVKNTLISQKDAVDTCTFRVKPNTPKLLSMPGKNGGQLWDLPSISMDPSQQNRALVAYEKNCDISLKEHFISAKRIPLLC